MRIKILAQLLKHLMQCYVCDSCVNPLRYRLPPEYVSTAISGESCGVQKVAISAVFVVLPNLHDDNLHGDKLHDDSHQEILIYISLNL